MRFSFFSAVLVMVMCDSPLAAQQKLPYDFPQFGRETANFFTAPLSWDGGDYLRLGILTASSFLVMQTADSTIRRSVLSSEAKYFNTVPMEGGRMWGELYMPCIVFSVYAAHSLIFDDIQTRKIAYEVGQASLYAGVITFIMKAAIGRARPYTNEGTTSFHPFNILTGADHSFPSGHSAAAMVLSTVLAKNTTSIWLKILAYTPPGFTLFSRIYQDKHWMSDAVFGGAMGYLIADWVVDHHEGNGEPSRATFYSTPTYPLCVSIVLN